MLSQEEISQIKVVVAEAVKPLADQIGMIGGELDDFREEVASAFVEISGQVARVDRRVNRLASSRSNGHGSGM